VKFKKLEFSAPLKKLIIFVCDFLSTIFALFTGEGSVYHLEPLFGFISQKSSAFEDNIYFNLQSYRFGSSNMGVKDLTKELKIGEKVSFRPKAKVLIICLLTYSAYSAKLFSLHSL